MHGWWQDKSRRSQDVLDLVAWISCVAVIALILASTLLSKYGFGLAKLGTIGTLLSYAPLPLLAISMVAALASAAKRLRRRRWLLEGRCTECGYDRKGLAAEQRCPECGKAI